MVAARARSGGGGEASATGWRVAGNIPTQALKLGRRAPARAAPPSGQATRRSRALEVHAREHALGLGSAAVQVSRRARLRAPLGVARDAAARAGRVPLQLASSRCSIQTLPPSSITSHFFQPALTGSDCSCRECRTRQTASVHTRLGDISIQTMLMCTPRAAAGAICCVLHRCTCIRPGSALGLRHPSGHKHPPGAHLPNVGPGSGGSGRKRRGDHRRRARAAWRPQAEAESGVTRSNRTGRSACARLSGPRSPH